MVGCSNPVQCQTAKRVECTCACGGANHSVLRKLLDNPETSSEGEEGLKELKEQQTKLKKEKRIERRKNRAVARKAQRVGS
mgnify:CR=1 FL=1